MTGAKLGVIPSTGPLAATVPATLEGLAALLSHVHLLHARDNYPALDDYWCYVLIASADTTLQRLIARAA